MAMILKKGVKKWQCSHGIEHESPYAVVDMIRGNKRKRQQSIRFDIFPSKNKREDGFAPLQSFEYTVFGEDFDKWFSVTAIDRNKNTYKRAYLYLHQLKDEVSKLVWEDWESDEESE